MRQKLFPQQSLKARVMLFTLTIFVLGIQSDHSNGSNFGGGNVSGWGSHESALESLLRANQNEQRCT
jgi:hypothetical protein